MRPATFEQIESAGREDWLAQLREDLRKRRYRPAAVRRVYIPKPGGVGERPLGIPTVIANCLLDEVAAINLELLRRREPID